MYGKREEKLNTVEEKQTYICILMRWGGGGVISRKVLRIGEFAYTYLALTLLNLNFPYTSETYSFNE